MGWSSLVYKWWIRVICRWIECRQCKRSVWWWWGWGYDDDGYVLITCITCWCWCYWYVGETRMPAELCPPQSKSDDRRSRSHSPRRELSRQLNAHHHSVSLADFDFVKVIGKGSFGMVTGSCWNLKMHDAVIYLPLIDNDTFIPCEFFNTVYSDVLVLKF